LRLKSLFTYICGCPQIEVFYAGGSNREERERQRQTDRQRDLFLFKNCLISHLVLFSVSREALTSRLGHVSVFIPPPAPPAPDKKFGESKFGKLTLIANEHIRFNFQIIFFIFFSQEIACCRVY